MFETEGLGPTFRGFWEKQDKFILDDLMQCNKSAWIVPDYHAQQWTRMLHQSRRHSDVGITEFFKSHFAFTLQGSISTSALKRISAVHGTGLFKCWSDLINRTDLERNRENEPPVKPTMSGNIQTIFYMLLGGICVALSSMAVELHGYILKVLNAAFCWFNLALWWIVQMSKNILYCKILRKR